MNRETTNKMERVEYIVFSAVVFTCIAFLTGFVNGLTLETDPAHTGIEGGSVTLKCEYRNVPSGSPYVISWRRPNRQEPHALVISVESGQSIALIGQDFIGRVMLTGNDASVNIANLGISDADTYECRIAWSGTRTVQTELSVFVPLKSYPKLDERTNNGTMVSLTRDVEHQFTCEVTGTLPAATFEWYIGGTEYGSGTISVSTTNGLKDTTSTLAYTPRWKNDEGMNVICQATNEATISIFSIFITMDIFVSPTATIQSLNDGDDYSVNGDQENVLTCTSTGKPAPSIKWFIGSDELESSPSTTPIPNSDDGDLLDVLNTLSFTSQWVDHHKWLKCKTDNAAIGQSSSQVKLDVNISAKHILISDNTKSNGYGDNDNVMVVDNLEHTLTCTTYGTKPATTIDWNADGVPMQFGETTPLANATDQRLSDTSRTTVFTPRWSYHGKTVTCEGSNIANIYNVKTRVNLDVQVSPRTSISRKSPAGLLQVINGTQTIIFCDAVGARPESFIQWTLAGDTISGTEDVTDNIEDSRLQDTKSRIILTPLYEKHQNMTLACKASNFATVKKSAPVVDHVNLDIFVPCFELTFENLNNGDNITLTAGITMTIICKAHMSHPATDIKWYLADEEITSNFTNVITWNLDGIKNTISNLMLTTSIDDFGKHLYCEGNQVALGTPIQTSQPLIVQYSAQVLNRDQNRSIADHGQTATLPCIASGFPIPQVRWYTKIDDVVTELANGVDRISVVEEKNETGRSIKSVLVIQNVLPIQDHKTYICQAQNIIGNSTHDIALVGRKTPDPPIDISVIEKTWENITITWTAGYDGGSPQHFIIFYRMSGIDQFDMTERIHGIEYTLTVLQQDTVYDIYIKARNVIGWSDASETVAVATIENPTPETSHPRKQNSNIGLTAGLTLAFLLMIALVIMLLVILRKGIIRKKMANDDEAERDNVSGESKEEHLQSTYEDISLCTVKGKSLSMVQDKQKETQNDTYMDLVPGNQSEGIYMKPGNTISNRNDDCTYADLTSKKEGDGIYMKCGQMAFDFPRDMLNIRNEIWRGKNHTIVLAKAWNINGNDGMKEVVIKMAKDGIDSGQERDIFQESTLMKRIPHHPNVIRLLGVCSESAHTFIILEYLFQGNLGSVLAEARSSISSGKKSRVVTEKQMISFAFDIAKGMTHLQDLGIVHRYLSPNHVLVDSLLHCKISNFGYASDVIETTSFYNKAGGSSPQRWMAIEALVDMKFTLKSDVWSFAVVMWQIFSLGKTPYEPTSGNHVLDKLQQGYQLKRPETCGDKLYDMMKQCWNRNPARRPNFTKLASTLKTFANDAEAYLDLSNYQNQGVVA